jgi:basic amino acid/polyamine antiporter, APA family
VPVPAGEARRPQRDVGVAVVGSVLGATLLYALVQMVVAARAPDLAHAKTPLVDAARAMFGAVGAHLMLGAALVSAFGFCASAALVGPRYVESLAADGFLPAFLGRRSPRGTPLAAIVVLAVVVVGLGAQLDFERLANVSVVAIVVQYIGTAFAVLAQRRKAGPSPGFRIPFGPVVPILAAAGSSFFLLVADRRDVVVGVAVLALGGVVGAVTRAGARVTRPT